MAYLLRSRLCFLRGTRSRNKYIARLPIVCLKRSLFFAIQAYHTSYIGAFRRNTLYLRKAVMVCLLRSRLCFLRGTHSHNKYIVRLHIVRLRIVRLKRSLFFAIQAYYTNYIGAFHRNTLYLRKAVWHICCTRACAF